MQTGFLIFIGNRGGEHHRVAKSCHYGAVRLFGYKTGFKGNGLAAHFNAEACWCYVGH